jgi:hypothetical protein
MNPDHKYITAIIFTLLWCYTAAAQVNVRATADRNKILIGEPIQLTVEVYTPLGTPVQWFPMDSIPHFEINTLSPVDTVENMDGKKMVQTLSITSFDSGRWQIPPFEVVVNGQPYYSDSLPVDVAFISFDPKEDYRDIKDIIDVSNPYMKYIPWAVGLIAAIALVLLIIIYRRMRKKKAVEKKIEVPLLSPYEEASRALDELRKKGTAQMGEKWYYTSMNDILRNYISRKFSIATFERTNEELIMQIARLNIPRDSFLSLAQSLRMADFVKFAKYRPSEEDNLNNLDTVRSSIEILDNNLASAV